MKKTLAVLSILSLFACHPNARATLFFEEGFNYSPGNLGLNGPWGSGNNNITVVTGGLSYPGLADAANPGNLMSLATGSSGSIRANFTSTPVTSGSVYYSFLAQCTVLPTSNQYLTDLLTDSGTVSGGTDPLSVYVGQSIAGSAFRIGVRHNGIGSGATYFTNNTSFILGATNLFVVRYTFGPNANDDSVSLYVNPTPGGAEPTADVTVSGPTGVDAANLEQIGFKANSSGAGTWAFDTLRVGDTWGDVVPGVVAAPEPSCGVLALLGLAALAARRRFGR